MCNNVFKWFLRAFAVVTALTVTSCADSPDEDDIVIPQLSLSIDGTTVDKGSAAMMTFDETGGTKQFSIQTTGEWEISGLENAPQSFVLTTSKGEEKYTGKGDETFTVTLGEATTASRFSMTVSVYASIFGQQKVADTRTISVVQTKGGELPVGKVLYANNFDKEEATQTFGSGTSWPYLDQFEGWKNHEGEGAAEVTYDFKSVSARANSKSDGSYSNYAGSGSNNLLFGGGGYLTIQNIAVSTTNLQLTFGTERYAYGESDNTFKNEEFLVTLSADGQSWSAPIAYAFEEGNDTNGKWNLATADFTLPDGTTKLYIKFATTLAGAHRVDDVKLTDGIGGQAITFDGGGDEPTPPTPPTPGEAIYANNFDKEKATKTYGTSNSSWPYIDQFEGWKNESGSGASAVTYEGSGVSVRANSESNGDFSNYAGSGDNNIFFGTNGTLTVGNIALTSNELRLTFGTERYLQGQDNTFKNEEFLVTLSADGKAWSKPVEYSFEQGKDLNGKWNVATADFTLPESTKTLYIKFVSTLKSAHRLDDVTLTAGDGGQAITFEGGGDEPTPPTPGAATVADLVAKCKAAGSTQTVLDEKNDVVVEAVVVTDKDGGNTNAKNLAIMAEGATEAGNGVLLYGSGITDPADDSFTWKSGDKVKVTLKAGQARACIYNGTYEVTGSANADWIAIEKIGTATVTPVEVTVDKLAEYQSMVVKVKDATSPAAAAEWCTADAFKTHKFTVGGSDLTVYVQKNAAAFVGKKFKASTKGDITGVVTVYKNNPQLAPRTADDVKAFNGEGGGDEPTPPTPSTVTVADLVAKCKAAGSTQTALDEKNDVVVEAVVVTDKDGGNTNAKNLAIMAEGATQAGNGVLLYGSGITDPADPSFTWKSGDKVKVTLKAGKARACTFNGTHEITGDSDGGWIAIEKIGTATVTPVEITVDKLADYQSMVVKVKDATSPAAAAEWCTADAFKTHKFTVGGSDLTVYVQKNAAAFVGKKFKASAKGDITGIVTLYKNNPQLAPRTADDVKAFHDDGSGDQPGGGDEPQPGKSGVATYVPSQMGYENAQAVTEVSLNEGAVTLGFDAGTNSNAPKYYNSGTALRCYGGNAITVKSASKISKIVIVRASGDGGNTLSANVGTLSEDTLTWTGESNEVVLTVSGTSGHIRISSMEITYGEGGGSGEQPGQPDQPDQPGQPTVGKTASLTLEDIAANGPRSYQEFSITAADGSVWTGFCSGTTARLQMGWNTDTSKDASKSYVLVPNADKVIKKITFTPEGGTTNDRVLALLPEDFKYTGQSADDVKGIAYACSAKTVKGSTEPLSIDLTGKNLKRFMIRAVGGAVYLTNITIEYAE